VLHLKVIAKLSVNFLFHLLSELLWKSVWAYIFWRQSVNFSIFSFIRTTTAENFSHKKKLVEDFFNSPILNGGFLFLSLGITYMVHSKLVANLLLLITETFLTSLYIEGTVSENLSKPAFSDGQCLYSLLSHSHLVSSKCSISPAVTVNVLTVVCMLFRLSLCSVCCGSFGLMFCIIWVLFVCYLVLCQQILPKWGWTSVLNPNV